MNVPFSIIKGAGGSKGVALLAVLIGLYAISQLKAQPAPAAAPRPAGGLNTRI